ncbi:MAG: hypothetical protein HUJ68_08285 [Clostridia bacterium]|nr:hypothetical protein [Clostridia bacterium]
MEKYDYLFGNNKDNEIQKYSKFYIITLTLLLINYIFWIWQFNFCTINMHILSSFILIIPIILITLMYCLTKKEKIRVKKGKIISIILIILFFILNFYTLIFVMVKEGTSREENPLKYKHICNIAGYKKIRFQFPDEISQNLILNNKVKFYYRPQFLQAGFCFELLLEMEKDEIDEYIKKYKGQVKEIIEVDEANSNNLYDKYGIDLPVIFEYKEGKEFFDNSKIYLFDSNSYKPNNWNHGCVYYMAKNERLKKLLLVTDVW